MPRDQMRTDCLNLALRATCYGNHRGSSNKYELLTAIQQVTSHFQSVDCSAEISREDALRIVHSALLLGRSYGLGAPDFRDIINEIVEEVPPTHRAAICALVETLPGRVVQ